LLYIAAGLLGILILVSLTFVFSFGRLFAQSRNSANLENEVKVLRKELEQADKLRTQLAENDKLRSQILRLMGTASVKEAPSLMEARTAGVDADLRLQEEDFMRSVPRSWPVRGPVTRNFLSATRDARDFHPGIDIAATAGAPVRAAAAGTVTIAGFDVEYGYLIAVEHGLGLETRYGHNQRLNAAVGDRIARGQVIAAVGNTGRSSGTHLHFEIRKDGVPVDPRTYLE
jgi:murein DD-endopeptidase MepM/ murein hydrolase activator NlpD